MELRDFAIDPSQQQMLLFYGYRRIKLKGREKAFDDLTTFVRSPGQFKWWLMVGPGGVGKSRLALELCLTLRGQQTAAFLSKDSTFADWADWQPRFPTLIVVDYVAQRAEQIGGITLLKKRWRCYGAKLY
jgi:hypothetical protein